MTVPRSFTHWTRLEPRPRNDELTDALRAQIRDPLWLLSRQWQFEEFHGDDAGSPVHADARVEHDPIRRYDLGLHNRGDDGGPREYTGEPLEALVEREPVLTAPDDPPARLSAEAGQYFLRLLSANNYETDEGPYTAADFPAALRLSDVGGDLDADGRAFDRVMTGRVLDGQAVFDAIAAAVSNLAGVADGATPEVSDVDTLPLPTVGRRTEAFDSAIVEFVDYYRSLFDEPEETTSAWRPERMEYEFAVTTGEDDTETVFSAPGYDGGRLDWHSFTMDDDRTLDGNAEDALVSNSNDGPIGDRGVGPNVEHDGDDQDSESGGGGGGDSEKSDRSLESAIRTVPTRATFPGMPATRWWEFEDTAVTLDDVTGAGASLPRLLLLEFAVQYGTDWFLVPVETPVGSLARVTSLSITDSFGCSQSIEPTADRTDEWNAFAFRDLPNADEPGLFVPPVLPTSAASDSVERVVLARDELANLGWGIERLVEGPVGDPIDRTEFEPPSLRISDISPATDNDETAEFVDLENPGDDDLDLAGWTVRHVADGEDTTVMAFEKAIIPPRGTLRLHTGASGRTSTPSNGDRLDRYCERRAPLWTDADTIRVVDESTAPSRVVANTRLRQPSEAFADYRISTAVEDHWFPFTVDPTSPTDYRLERARLLDAETLDIDPAHLPEPLGKVLNPDPMHFEADADTLRLYEEELTRDGTEISRHYQLSSWSTGRQHLWAGRRVHAGRGESSSDLRFDVLEDRSGTSVSIGDGVDPSDDSDSGTGGDTDDEDDPTDDEDGHTDDTDDDGEQRGGTSVGLDENVVAALAYLFGWVSGIIVLLAKREGDHGRFHAAQSIVVFGTLFAARVLLWIAQVVVFILYYPAYSAGFYYPGGPSDPTTYIVLSWTIGQLTLGLWVVVAALWLYLVVWSALGRDPLVPGATRLACSLARRVAPDR